MDIFFTIAGSFYNAPKEMNQISNNSQVLKPKTFVFCIAAAVAVLCMFFNWLVIDLDLGYIYLDDIAEDITVFTLPGMLGEIEDALSPLGSFLPEELRDGLGMSIFFGYAAMLLGICAIGCYVLAIVCRVTEKPNAGKLGAVAAISAILSAVVFMALVTGVVGNLAGEDYAFSVLGDIIVGPCGLTLLAALVSAATAGKGSLMGEDWERHYTERIDTAIAEHPHTPETEWVCSSCMTVNKQEQRFCKCGCSVGLK